MVIPLNWKEAFFCSAIFLPTAWIFVRVFLTRLWHSAWLRRGLLVFFLLHIGALAGWAIGKDVFSSVPTKACAAIVCGSLIVGTFVLASLPLSGLLLWLGIRKRSKKLNATDEEVMKKGISRRRIVQATAIAIPVAAGATAFKGFANGNRPPALRPIHFSFSNLPREFDGLTILQLSDLHVGLGRNADDIRRFLEQMVAGGTVPDLITFTGDVADDLRELSGVLAAARDVRPKYGVFSAPGNHDYFHDVARFRRSHKEERVHLLINEGETIAVGQSKLYLGGVDDPISIRKPLDSFMENATARALRGAPSDAFRILLSHRPEGFAATARHGVDLTLSGHTHGGQIGFNGMSAFQPIWKDRYLWGAYRRNRSTLYTTSGFGHWFPFRLGCPPRHRSSSYREGLPMTRARSRRFRNTRVPMRGDARA